MVAERSFDAVTVRELSRLAGVSTRTFYRHYSGKEECFLHTHLLVVRRVLKRLGESQIGVRDPEERMRRAIDAIVHEWDRDPKAARLMLIDANAAGPRALEQSYRANKSLEIVISESLGRHQWGAVVTALVAKGVVAGLESVARVQLLDARRRSLAGLSDPLANWALSYHSPSTAQLEKLNGAFSLRACKLEPSPPVELNSAEGRDRALAPKGDLALLLTAVAKLATDEDHGSITVRKILTTAGVPRRSFEANFSHAEDCLVAAFELQAGAAIAGAKRAGKKGLTPAGCVYRAVVALCARIAQDAALANLCFGRISVKAPRMAQCHRQLTTEVGGLIENGLTPPSTVNDLTIEASVGAFWGILHGEVLMGRARRVCQIAPALAYLLLAPAVGASAAAAAIREEQALSSQG
jgi:AcrR family transcriptional regulator